MMKMLSFSLALCSVLIFGTAHAASISVNFAYGFGGVEGESVGAAAGITGSSVWNNYNSGAVGGTTGSETDALDNSGGNSGADVSWTAQQTWADGAVVTENGKLLRGYLDDNGALGVNVDVVEIPYAEYDVHVFFNHDNTDGIVGIFDIDVNGTTHTSTDAFTYPHGDVIDAGNSITVTGLSGNLNLNQGARISHSESVSNISGFEIVEVPEPASLLLSLGGLGLFLASRRRS